MYLSYTYFICMSVLMIASTVVIRIESVTINQIIAEKSKSFTFNAFSIQSHLGFTLRHFLFLFRLPWFLGTGIPFRNCSRITFLCLLIASLYSFTVCSTGLTVCFWLFCFFLLFSLLLLSLWVKCLICLFNYCSYYLPVLLLDLDHTSSITKLKTQLYVFDSSLFHIW